MEEAEASEKVGFRDHLDNPIIFALLIIFIVYAGGCLGRAAGTALGQPGIVAFFGG